MSKNKILVADDESRMRKLIRDYLVREDYEVVEAENGEQALDMFYMDSEISLIILDVMMPDISGFDAAKVLKMDSETNNIPIIFLTALNTPMDLVRSFQLGADEFISKPFNKEELIARIYNIQGLHKTVSNFLDDK